jgi:Tat protein translocase TatB subunit
MFNIGFTELLVILVIVLLIFGPRKLPELARALGKALRELRRASESIRDEIELESIESELKERGHKGREDESSKVKESSSKITPQG